MNHFNPRISGKNRVVLLLILLLDLIGFSLIFPLIPHLLDYYVNRNAYHPIDSWLPFFLERIHWLIPTGESGVADEIVILGGMITSLYAFVQFLITPWWGRLSDIIGRRPVLILTGFGLAVSYLFWFFSSSFTLFIISRIIGGFMAGNLGVATASMADMSSEENRTKSMGLLGAAFGVGFIIGPVVGGVSSTWDMTSSFSETSWIHPFSSPALIAFFLSVTGAIVNIILFRETNLALSKDPTWIKNPFRTVRKELKIPGFNPIVALNFLFLFTFSGFEFSLSFFYRLDYQLTPLQIGLIFLYSGVIIVFGQGFLVRKLSERYEEKTIFLYGIILMGPSTALLSFSPPSIILSLLFLFPISLGASLVQPSLTGMASLMAPANRQGIAMGAFRSAGSLARAIGPASGAYFYWIFGVRVAYSIIGGLLISLFFLSYKLPRIVKNKKKESIA